MTAIHMIKSKYNAIIQSLPSDYEKTLQAAQDHLTDDQICEVLTSSNPTVANKAILNCLMEKVKCTADVIEFCELLDKIISILPDPGVLAVIVNDLRTGELLHILTQYFVLPCKVLTACSM